MKSRLLLLGLLAGACGPANRSGEAWERRAARQGLDVAQIRTQLRDAATQVRDTLAREREQGLLRLRLRPDEVRSLFDENAAARIALLPTGFEPSPAERRWSMLGSLASTPVVGFCGRGVRREPAGGADGFLSPTLVVDRLLIVGREPDGLWAVWVEGLVLTPSGWRLLPTVPFEQQVGTPRRDHAELSLWDCDVGVRPGELP